MQRTGRARRLVAVVVVRATALLLVVVVVVVVVIRRHFLKSARGLANSCACAVIYVLFGFMSIFFKTKKREAKMVAPNTYGDASQKAAKQVLSSFFGTIATASLILVGSSAAFNIAGKQIVKSNKKRLEKVHAVRWVAFHIVWDV